MQFVLLDDAHSHRDTPSSRLYTDLHDHWIAHNPETVGPTLGAIERGLNAGLYMVVLFSYELGGLLLDQPKAQDYAETPSDHSGAVNRPLISAYAFKHVTHLDGDGVDSFLRAQIQQVPPHRQHAGVADLTLDIDEDGFRAAIGAIHEHIRAGDVYQVNYTFRLHGRYYGHPIALYQRLRARQPTAFRALVHTDHETVLSLSPELFLRHDQGRLVARPMKGTWNKNTEARAITPDEKNRAENLMIVDLLRNDLGRISEVGSVKVPELYQLEDIGSLVQMTSTIESRLKTSVGLKEVLAATFPCGSVTGAPKQMAMQVIRELEGSPRGLYCGGIGWVDPPAPKHSGMGDFAMSVAIRTLELDDADQSFVMGIGSGITIDSDAKAEWDECLSKSRFLSELSPSVGLIETMRLECGAVHLREQHIERLLRSADRLGIPINRERISAAIDQEIQGLGAQGVFRLRMEVQPGGDIVMSSGPVALLTEPVTVFWAEDILPTELSSVHSSDTIVANKTTARGHYDSAWREAERRGGFDALFVNEQGEVTEGGRTSLFAKIDGRWCTPPLSSGVLPGVMRAQLLADPEWNALETVMSPEQIRHAEALVVVNALRGVLRARLA